MSGSPSWLLVLAGLLASLLLSTAQVPPKSTTNDGDYNTLHRDGSYEFGYANKDRGASYHISQANRANVVRGRFGSREPGTGAVKETIYTAGPRGFRARGPNIHRKMDLDQRPRGPIGNKDDPYFDPNEDPSYSYQYKTPTHEKQEAANRLGDVTGRYSFIDDIGERHNVEYIAGKDTGFHVKSAYPDSSPGAIGPLYYNGPLVRGEKKQRGHTSIQRGLDGSYRFISAGPDQRRTESSDASGNVRGSYSFLDDKGVQRTVHYIAGPGIGYRVVKNSNDPYIPSFFPVLPDYRDPELNKPFVPTNSESFPIDTSFSNDKDDNLDDIFGRPGGSAASGHVKPPKNNRKPVPPQGGSNTVDKNNDFDVDDASIFGGDSPTAAGEDSNSNKPANPVVFPESGSGSSGFGIGSTGFGNGDDDDSIFGIPTKPSLTDRPSSGSSRPGEDTNEVGSDNDEENDDIFGAKPGASRPSNARPTKPTNNRPANGRPTNGRPGNAGRPGRPDNSDSANGSRPPSRPGNGRPTSGRPNRPNGGRPGFRPTVSSRPSNPGVDGSSKPESTKPDEGSNTRPESSSRPSGGRPGVVSRPGNNEKPNESGSGVGRPSSSENSGSGVSFVNGDNDDDIFGAEKPTRLPSNNGYLPDTPDSGSSVGSNSKPGSDLPPTRPDEGSDESIFGPAKPQGPTGSTGSEIPTTGSGFLDGTDEEDQVGYPGSNRDKDKPSQSGGTTQINITGHKGPHKGGTIFHNIGKDTINFPPGSSVRAHVQSIDLFPFGTKTPSPSEAVAEELKKHGSR